MHASARGDDSRCGDDRDERERDERRYGRDVPRQILFQDKERRPVIKGALRRGEKLQDPKSVVDRLLNAHPDEAVRAEVRRLCRDAGWFRKTFPVHDLVRLGVSRADYRMLYEYLGKME